MLELNLTRQQINQAGPAGVQKLELVEQANHLFWQAYGRGKLGSFWAGLTRRSSQMLDLAGIEASRGITGRHYAGTRVVPIQQIQGSEGRYRDFDRHFNPLRPHLKERWQKMALAWLTGVTLPPVKLIQVGDTYFVEDGHHRISVARALGQTDIDAEVTVWEK